MDYIYQEYVLYIAIKYIDPVNQKKLNCLIIFDLAGCDERRPIAS